MNNQLPAPAGRLTVITLGVRDMRASIAFYEALGFARKFRATGEEVAFFETGGAVIGLYPWSKLALDAALPEQPRPAAFAARHRPGIAARRLKSTRCWRLPWPRCSPLKPAHQI